MIIEIPEVSLVVLIGASGSGKSTFARQHFASTETLSSDFCRGLVSDDETSLDATKDAFDVLHYIAEKRLKRMRLTVVDATNVQPFARKPLLKLARRYHVLPVAIVLDMPEEVCQDRNAERPDRNFGAHVVRNHRRDLKRSLKKLRKEGFKKVYVLKSPEDVAAVTVERTRLWNDRKDDHGPFDIIGDVHGCADELEDLLATLGYAQPDAGAGYTAGNAYRHPEGRKAVFVGDLVDRGPRSLDVLRIAKSMVEAGTALCVPGNHDDKLQRKLYGRNVKVAHGLEKTLAEFEALPEEERQATEKEMQDFIFGLVSHYLLDDGRLVVAHAGMREDLQGRASKKVRDFALYGETTGETDAFGLPVRHDWAQAYRGEATVVYGHTPVPEPVWVNGTINIDTGCVFGGRLTALRYPERELVSVKAQKAYADSVRPFKPPSGSEAAGGGVRADVPDTMLHLEDVQGKRVIDTRLQGRVTVREENATAALEIMSRYAVDPRWLIYLPPTMAPTDTSEKPGLLEHPAEAFAFYRHHEVPTVVCEEKHMGSRAVVVVCKDDDVARHRFGITTGEVGIVYTRTGRRFFNDLETETALLERVRMAASTAGLWDEMDTDWMCLDAELMPWSAKAQALLREQYAAVGAAAQAALPEAVQALERAHARDGVQSGDALRRFRERAEQIAPYVDAYRQYCWPVETVEDYRLAPFHVMATEGAVHIDKNHRWHMQMANRLASAGGNVLFATEAREVDVTDLASLEAATEWWMDMTGRGGEGMVVKPLDFIVRGRRGVVQPAVKCRGREYLRIIYGPEYLRDEHLTRLRKRGLGRKRSMALREFALGIEGLERFVRREPLRRVHECVFGVLALESEPVDPRL